MPDPLICERCDAPISSEELGEGLAVRVDGQLVCQNCIDTLPGEAQIQINQLRALKGLTATTYQVTLPSAPRLQLFSFTTSSNITNHRRKLVTDGFFEAPALPPPSERNKASTTPADPVSKLTTTRIMRRRRLSPAVIAAAATVLLLGGGAGVLSLLASRKPATKGDAITAEAPPPKPEAPKPLKTRLDYAVEPLQAWTQATADRDCPDYVRNAIAQELAHKRVQQLDEAEAALSDRRLDDTASLANALVLPDDLAFRDLKTRESDLRNRLLAARTRPPMPAPVPVPVPVPETAPTPAPAPAQLATIVQPSADGRTIILHPDAADLTGTKLQVGGPADARVLGFWTNPNESPVWRVRFATSGSYAITTKSSAKEGESVLVVQIADRQTETTVPRTPSYEQFIPLSLGTIEIARAGELLVRLRAKNPAAWKPINLADLTLRRVDPPAPAVSSSDSLLIAARDLLGDNQPAEWRREGATSLRLLTASGGASRALTLAGGSYQVWIKASHRTKDALLSLAIGNQRAKPVQIKAGVPQWYRVQGEQTAVAVLPAGAAMLEVAVSPKDTQIHEIYLAGDAAPGADDAVKLKLGKPPTWTTAPPPMPIAPGIPGRFVRIQLPRRGVMSLAEVEVFSNGVNVAPRGTAKQASTSNDGEAGRAIDGNTNGDYGAGSTTHTDDQDQPWWEVDLGGTIPIEAVTIWNRTDQNLHQRLNGFALIVLDAERREVARSTQEQAPQVSARISLIGDTAGAVSRPAVVWKPQFLQVGGKDAGRPLPLDGSVIIPAGWPGGCDTFYRSLRTGARKRQALHLDLALAGADSIVLLLHAQRPDRKQLVATLVDAAGKNVPLPSIAFSNDGWTVAVISTRGLALDARSLNALILEDEANMDGTPDDAGFILARAMLVSGREATMEDLGLRPPALLRDDNRTQNLKRTLSTVAAGRKRPNASWQRLLEPDRLRVLVGPSNENKDWEPWRKRTKERLETLTPGKLPNPTFADLVMQDSWLDNMTKGQNPAVDPAATHFAVLWPMGDELALGGVNQALDGFWKKRIEQLITAGILPVIVLGPNRQSGNRRDEAEQLWPKLAEFISSRQLGLAMVDLRSVKTGAGGELAQADADQAAQLLTEAMSEYLYHLRRMMAVKQ